LFLIRRNFLEPDFSLIGVPSDARDLSARISPRSSVAGTVHLKGLDVPAK
jgi:hypothetical protein